MDDGFEFMCVGVEGRWIFWWLNCARELAPEAKNANRLMLGVDMNSKMRHL